MNLIKKLPVIFLMFIWSCSPSTTKKKDITFADYLKTLDTVPLPFEHACTGAMLPKLSMHFDSMGFEKYKDPNCARPLGILFRDKFNIATIDISLGDDCEVPFLSSFNRKGIKLDSLDLYQSSYDDTASSSMPYIRIDKTKRILIIDTIKNWNRDTSLKPFTNSISIKIDSTIYYLSKNGKFIKEKPKK